MSLSQEAIQLITDTALLAAGKTLSTYSPTAVLPEGVKVVDLEKYQVGRSRFRGVLSTNSLIDFSTRSRSAGVALMVLLIRPETRFDKLRLGRRARMFDGAM